MRRFKALLIAAGLVAAPVSAAAQPSPPSPDPSTHFERSASRGRLGVLVMSLTPELRKHFGAADDRGVMVARVDPLSPASRAGLQAGDVITEVKGRTVSDPVDILSAIADAPRDQSISIKLVRDGKPLDLSAKLMSEATSWLEPTWSMGWFNGLLRPFASRTPALPDRV